MNFIKCLGAISILFLFIIPMYSQIDDLEITGTTYSDTVKFSVVNTGTESISISYIVIQDQVLMLTQGSTTILAADSLIVKVQSNDPASHTYTIDIDEAPNYRDTESGRTFTIGRQDAARPERLMVYPTLVQDVLTIKLPFDVSQSFSIRLYNLKGQEVFRTTQVAPGMFKLHRPPLPSGVYMLSVSGEDYTAVQKIIFN